MSVMIESNRRPAGRRGTAFQATILNERLDRLLSQPINVDRYSLLGAEEILYALQALTLSHDTFTVVK